MYSGFNLSFSKEFFCMINDNPLDSYKYYYKKGIQLSNNITSKEMESLANTILNPDNEYLDADSILTAWFPQLEADIFLSHSHDDSEFAIALAGWLTEELGLRVFIDSNVWNNINDLLWYINKKFSDRTLYKSGYAYNYEKCNKASQHANIMLLTALQHMIDNVESFFILNTNHSIQQNNTLSFTNSPWIFAEINCANTIKRKSLDKYRLGMISEGFPLQYYISGERKPLAIKYNIDLNKLISINDSHLLSWMNEYSYSNPKPENALDCLYKIVSKEG